MASNDKSDGIFTERSSNVEETSTKKVAPMKHQILYANVIYFVYWHLAALYGIYLCFTSAKWQTLLFSLILFSAAEIGITAGAHRLWSHRSYKAKLPLQIILIVFNSLAFQNSAMHWARDHRLHHKHSDTDADPHNATRGFFFSHVGWLLTRKSKEVREKGRTLDISDLTSNPVLRFQKKYALPVFATACFILPTVIPMYFWGESFINAYHINLLRYVCNMNATFLINSAAHMWGYKPYDKDLLPAENLVVSTVTLGEGFHNYHHAFPWDYKAAELGNNYLNMSTLFIDFFSWIGWAYDLKSVPDDIIRAKAKRSGDGSPLVCDIKVQSSTKLQ